MASMPRRNEAKEISRLIELLKDAYIAQSDTCQKREENMSECWPYKDVDLGKGKFLRKRDSIRKVIQNFVCYENSVWEIIFFRKCVLLLST